MCVPCQIKRCVYTDDDGGGGGGERHLTTLNDNMQSAAGDRLSSSSSSSSLDSDGNDDAMTSAWREFMALSSDSEDDDQVDAPDEVDGRLDSTELKTWHKRYIIFSSNMLTVIALKVFHMFAYYCQTVFTL